MTVLKANTPIPLRVCKIIEGINENYASFLAKKEENMCFWKVWNSAVSPKTVFFGNVCNFYTFFVIFLQKKTWKKHEKNVSSDRDLKFELLIYLTLYHLNFRMLLRIQAPRRARLSYNNTQEFYFGTPKCTFWWPKVLTFAIYFSQQITR